MERTQRYLISVSNKTMKKNHVFLQIMKYNHKIRKLCFTGGKDKMLSMGMQKIAKHYNQNICLIINIYQLSMDMESKSAGKK